MYVGIDLSLRSTGLVSMTKSGSYTYQLVTSDPKKLNNEELLNYNWLEIKQFISQTNPEIIAIEGLSFGSISGSKDILAGNFWFLRTMLSVCFPKVKVEIVPVLTWRNKIISKEENRLQKQNSKEVTELKKLMKSMNKEEKKQAAVEHEELILKSSIKYVTFLKLPDNVQTVFKRFSFTKGCFDLTDAYHICDYIRMKDTRTI